ncbi:MAG: zinc metallopeptidase [Pirellulaceae bacterium]|nr:zinc metallopeptidase [Pirellulaceae bacterium]
MMYFDPIYFVFIAPALLLAMVAQWMVRSAYSQMSQVAARTSGYDAARSILDANGLQSVGIQQVPGEMSDHYDPRHRVLRLSPGVYRSNSMAAVGIAAHEAGHAIQHAQGYAPLAIRNMAVPAANFGGSIGTILCMVGLGMTGAAQGAAGIGPTLFLVGIIGFGATVAFQLINLPVEFDASSRAKTQLVELGIVSGREISYVSKVLNAAALTYVAATMQAVMILAYYIFRYLLATQRGRD